VTCSSSACTGRRSFVEQPLSVVVSVGMHDYCSGKLAMIVATSSLGIEE